MRTLRALVAVALLVPACLVGMPLQWLALKLRSPAARTIPVVFHRWVGALLGVRCTLVGRPAAERPLLLVSNHVSWIDITVLSALMPLSFIAKSEVGAWPLFGTFARLQRSVFVERARRAATGAVNRAIAGRLRRGDALVLFAEGTSSDGTRVLPFRTALLGAARDAALAGGGSVWVQPVAVTYVGRHGLPLSRHARAALAWYGDMDLLPHLGAVLAEGGIDVVVAFGAPVEAGDGSDRKRLARHVEAEVRRLNRQALRGACREDRSQSRPEHISSASRSGSAGMPAEA